ncbi:MAG: hypothetical protein QNJ72_15480 [Pleurocapsa sp. MO_226.B13]|nr:hypothetical protein [Pleurocapsa sp. MO_226.B13]
MSKRVLIVGTGVTGLTCAQILSRQGWQIDILSTIANSKPPLLLNYLTCQLLQNIWDDRELILAEGHILEERGVSWGSRSSLKINPEPAIAIKGDLLVSRLLEKLRQTNSSIGFLDLPQQLDWHHLSSEYDWVIDAGGRKANCGLSLGKGRRWNFGQRQVISTDAVLNGNVKLNRYWIESIEEIGWLFLASFGERKGILQGMIPETYNNSVAKLESFLTHSQYISPLIKSWSDNLQVFAAFPSLSLPFCGNGWLAVGDAAISLDPLSGDGTGYGLRGAILATSILNAVMEGEKLDDCLNHYKQRLARTFTIHLHTCFNYYQEMFANISYQWQIEINLMRQSILVDVIELIKSNEYKFHLEGFHLTRKVNL